MYKQGESGLRKALKQFHMCEEYFVKIQVQEQGLHQKILHSHEDKQTYENKLFSQSSCFGNLLTTLYLIENGNDAKAKSINDGVMKCFRHSLLARYLNVHILLKSKQFAKANKKIEDMKANNYEKLENIIVKADYAYALVQLPPHFYSHGIKLYEEAIEELKYIDDSSEIQKIELPEELLEDIKQPKFKLYVEIHKIIWSYFLIQTFNRLMNSGIIASQKPKIKVTPKLCFKNICNYIPNILCSKFAVDLTYHARAYIELYDSLKKVRHKHKDILQYLPVTGLVKNEPESWLQKAYELAPDDGHVLERLGRHYRTVANNFDDFKQAAELLEICVQKYPRRHVALHHLALCNRSMWIHKNEFPEAALHHNPVRSGHEPKRYGNKKKKKVGNKGKQPKGYRGQAKNHKSYSRFQDTVYLSESEFGAVADPVDAVENDANGESTDEGINSDENDKIVHEHHQQSLKTNNAMIKSCKPIKEFSNTERKALPNTKQKTLFPNKQTEFSDMPKTFTKPDYYDTFRTNNPVDQGYYTEYLLHAIEKLECANEVVNRTCSSYLIDLGRLYVSYNDIDKGVKYLDKGMEILDEAQSCTGANDHNKAYACEQYALCLHYKYLNRNKCNHEIILDDLKCVYRQAVIYSVRAREKSKIAFYNLKNILTEQIQQEDDAGQKAIHQEELALLNSWVENLETAKSFFNDVPKEDVLHSQWELVLSFKRHGDNMSAYQYMKPLLVPQKVEKYLAFLDEKDIGEDDTPYTRTLDIPIPLDDCLEIYMSVATHSQQNHTTIVNVINSTESDKQNEKKSMCNIYKEAFDNLWYCQSAMVSEQSTSCKSFDILILSEEESSEMQIMKEVLESYCGLSTFSEETVIAGQPHVREIEKNAKKAKASIILVDEIFDTDDQIGQQWLTATDFIHDKSLICIPKIYVSFKAGGTDKQKIPSISLDKDVSLKSDMDKHQFVQELYKTLLIDYPKKIKEWFK